MGHNSKKKKRGGGGSGKKKKASKDHGAYVGDDDNELLSEEITALCAIFQDDCKIVSGSQPQIIIKLRPHSKDMGYEDLDVSALLLVRCLPGYPYKCPKLQITPEKGLSKSDADKLLSLINDQANSNAREGRVMIFNLVEAAQEFLSEIVPAGQSQGSSWNWSFGVDETNGINSTVPLPKVDGSKLMHEIQEKKLDKQAEPIKLQDIKQGPVLSPNVKLETLEEESEDSKKSIYSMDSSRFLLEEMEGNGGETEKENSSESFTSLAHDQGSQHVKRDLIMVHLLHLACTKGPLADSLPQITTELQNIGILSEWAKDLASKPISLLNRTFNHVFRQHMVSSRISQFWELTSELEGPSTSLPSSRYLNDFEELQSVGHGGFGHVVLCKNKLDGRQYAVKKIRLKDKSLPMNDRILREVATLSRLQHQHVVRYYQLLYTCYCFVFVMIFEAYFYFKKLMFPFWTLRQVFESYSHFDKELAWHLFRQIVEGLAHIHGQGIIHRDLTPNNIFFDARNDIKIGDFGLAKFLKLEQLDQDPGFPADTTGVSLDGTGQVGTYFYTCT
ncbi:hypothetical protein M0R45_019610 [Rubus argutus]|uniref:Uncharacterized protein n=1 Tax=Rubus argutus TaxID=59490 RepID=A0AAW1X9J1_RUBAR